MTDEAKALVDHIRENYDLCECEHGFRLYEGHTCPNDFCDRRDMRRLTDHIEALSAENERLNAMLTAATYEAKAMMDEIKRLGGGMRVSLGDLP